MLLYVTRSEPSQLRNQMLGKSFRATKLNTRRGKKTKTIVGRTRASNETDTELVKTTTNRKCSKWGDCRLLSLSVDIKPHPDKGRFRSTGIISPSEKASRNLLFDKKKSENLRKLRKFEGKDYEKSENLLLREFRGRAKYFNCLLSFSCVNLGGKLIKLFVYTHRQFGVAKNKAAKFPTRNWKTDNKKICDKKAFAAVFHTLFAFGNLSGNS